MNFRKRWVAISILLLSALGFLFYIAFTQLFKQNPLDKIQHIIIIIQENRSFDTYFGTYPGADGIPMEKGSPTVCSPNQETETCVKPYLTHEDASEGGPIYPENYQAAVNSGKMDGFVAQQLLYRHQSCEKNKDYFACGKPAAETDSMGYHDRSQIPNYWSYADHFVLQDHMFIPAAAWSLPNYLYLISGWSAKCLSHNPNSCKNNLVNPEPRELPDRFAWTDITYLLHKDKVSWAYYFEEESLLLWNPLPRFLTVEQNSQKDSIQPLSQLYKALKNDSLPQVVWVGPGSETNEHPPSLISRGQAHVTDVINAIMKSKYWKDSAIFLTWDDGGGFYDHVVPPKIDSNGYGSRIPGLVLSPYAKKGYIDHQLLSFDAFLKFIEDRFLNGQRLDPKTDGRPDPRPDVRENAKQLGNVINDFDFNQSPLPPLILSPYPVKK